MNTATDGVVRVAGGEVAYRVLGTGSPVLVPWCNIPWPDVPIVARLAQDHRVVLASPLGYQTSTRLPADEYGAARAVDDLVAVCDALGFTEFAVFGYSLSAALAAWLTTVSPRATLAVLGGFPLLGSYQRVLDGVLSDVARVDEDPGFDPGAAVAFYRDLANRPDGALVTDGRCPTRAFVGRDDEVLHRFAHPDLAGALRAFGVPTTVIDGTNHLTAILATDRVLDVFVGA